MALCEVRWFSNVIQKMVGTYIVLPECGKPPYATYYLLHGLSDDYSAWQRRTRIESHVRGLPLIVVMPDGFRGFYTNNEAGPAYARYIGEELVSFIDRTFATRPARDSRAIGGLSMGGYGAIRIALEYHGTFASANSHSGALLHGAGGRGGLPEPEQHRIFGPRPAGSSHDLLHLAAQARLQEKFPRLLIDCGTEDVLLNDNRAFHAELDRLGITHTYREFAGGHDWDYWDQHVQDALAFHMAELTVQ